MQASCAPHPADLARTNQNTLLQQQRQETIRVILVEIEKKKEKKNKQKKTGAYSGLQG